MEELEIFYKELQERLKILEKRKKTTLTEGRIRENFLMTVRVQQLLLDPKTEEKAKFQCYEVHVVQSRMYGCAEQCKECRKQEQRAKT